MLIAIFFNQRSLEKQQAILWWHIYDSSGFEERSFQVYHRKIWTCNVGEISRRRKRNVLITRLKADESQTCNLFSVKVKNLRYSMMYLIVLFFPLPKWYIFLKKWKLHQCIRQCLHNIVVVKKKKKKYHFKSTCYSPTSARVEIKFRTSRLIALS